MTAVLRHLWAATLLLAALAGLLSPGQSSAEGSPLACPAGQAVWLQGTAAPALPLVVRFAGRVVGGGVTDATGRWELPLVVHERRGVYPVQVERRDSATPVAAWTCFVDLPLNATPTSSPTSLPSRSPSPTLSDEVRSTQPGQQGTPTATLEAPTSRPATDEGLPPSDQPSSEAPRQPFVPTPTTEVPTPLPRETTPAVPPPLAILGVQPHNPADAELFEYVVLANQGAAPQELAGWTIVHGTTGETYPLPAASLPAGGVLLIWSGAGVNDPTTGTLFWPAEGGRWTPGDRVLLRDPAGQTVSTAVVSDAATEPLNDTPPLDTR